MQGTLTCTGTFGCNLCSLEGGPKNAREAADTSRRRPAPECISKSFRYGTGPSSGETCLNSSPESRPVSCRPSSPRRGRSGRMEGGQTQGLAARGCRYFACQTTGLTRDWRQGARERGGLEGHSRGSIGFGPRACLDLGLLLEGAIITSSGKPVEPSVAID